MNQLASHGFIIKFLETVLVLGIPTKNAPCALRYKEMVAVIYSCSILVNEIYLMLICSLRLLPRANVEKYCFIRIAILKYNMCSVRQYSETTSRDSKSGCIDKENGLLQKKVPRLTVLLRMLISEHFYERCKELLRTALFS